MHTLFKILQHVSAVNCSHPQGATRVDDIHSVLYMLSNINGKIFAHASVIPLTYDIVKIVSKLNL